MKNFLGSTSFLVVLAIFLTGMGLLATPSIMGTAVANKVTGDIDNVKQGALGEYYSKDGREKYDPNDPSGRDHGQDTANFAQNSEEISGPGVNIQSLGKSTSYIASGVCHSQNSTNQCQ
jgi:hypothetical protein